MYLPSYHMITFLYAQKINIENIEEVPKLSFEARRLRMAVHVSLSLKH